VLERGGKNEKRRKNNREQKKTKRGLQGQEQTLCKKSRVGGAPVRKTERKVKDHRTQIGNSSSGGEKLRHFTIVKENVFDRGHCNTVRKETQLH